MNLSKNSLLFKYWNFHDKGYTLHQGTTTLCELFWTTVLLILRDIGITAFCIIAAVALTMTPGALMLKQAGVIASMQGFIYLYPWYYTAGTLVLGTIFWAVLILVVWAALTFVSKIKENLEGWIEDRKFTRELKMEMAREEELSFHNMWQKFKIAKREKLCPLVKVVDK